MTPLSGWQFFLFFIPPSWRFGAADWGRPPSLKVATSKRPRNPGVKPTSSPALRIIWAVKNLHRTQTDRQTVHSRRRTQS